MHVCIVWACVCVHMCIFVEDRGQLMVLPLLSNLFETGSLFFHCMLQGCFSMYVQGIYWILPSPHCRYPEIPDVYYHAHLYMCSEDLNSISYIHVSTPLISLSLSSHHGPGWAVFMNHLLGFLDFILMNAIQNHSMLYYYSLLTSVASAPLDNLSGQLSASWFSMVLCNSQGIFGFLHALHVCGNRC